MGKPPKDNERLAAAKKTVRTFTDWTFSRIRAAELAADSGRMSEPAKVCEWLLGDSAVASGLETRRDALMGIVPTFEASGDKRRSSRAVKALEAGEDYWASNPETELGQLIMWRTLLGVAPGRLVWSDPLKDHGGRVLPILEFWNPANGLRYDFPRATWLATDLNGAEVPLVAGDGSWMLHTLAKVRPWMLGAWRRLSRPVLLKHLAYQDWSRHSEKAATLVATSNSDSTAPQRRELAADLSSAGADAVVVLQAGFNLELLELTANTRDIYQAQIEMADKVIATLLRGGNLSTNVDKGGSKAATESQVASGELPRLRADAEALSTTIHDQQLIWWAEFNFGDPALAPWPIYNTTPKDDVKLKAEGADKAMDAASKADALGYEIDNEKFEAAFGIDWLGERKPPEPPPAPLPVAPLVQPTKVPKPSGPLAISLSSGIDAREAQGFIDGQIYVDAVADSATASALSGVMAEVEEQILAALDAADSYDDLRDRLRAIYTDTDPDAFSGIVARAMKLAALAGAQAVNQDL